MVDVDRGRVDDVVNDRGLLVKKIPETKNAS